MSKTKILIILFSLNLLQLSLLLAAESFPGCPAETLRTDVALPATQESLIFCYRLNLQNERVNHGPWWRLDSAGKPITKLWYQDGEIGEKPPVLATLENDKKTPESPTHDLGFMRSVVHEIFMRFLPVARQHRGPLAVGGFETRDCLTNNSGLLNFLRGERSSFAFDFRFHRGRCSIQGRHQMQLRRPHQVRLELNDLRDYNQLEFLLLADATIIDDHTTEFSFKISNAHLRSSFGGIKFSANYHLIIDSKGRAKNDHQGQLHLTEFRGENINQFISLKAPIVPVTSSD